MRKSKTRVLYVMPSPSSTGGMRMITGMFYEYGVFEDPDVIHFDSFYTWGENKLVRALQSVFLKINLIWTILVRRIDVVFVITSSYWGFYDKVFYCLLAKLAGARTVLNPVGGHFERFYAGSPLNKWLVPRALKVPDAVVVGTSYWYNYFSQFPVRRLVDIPNPVIMTGPAEAQPKPADHIWVLFLARVEIDKGVTEFVRAMELVHAADKRFRFVIAGSGTYLATLKEQLSAHVASGLVTITGFIGEEQKRELLTRSSIYVLPTYFEVLPISILEAMSYRNVIISTRVGGIPDAVEDNVNGFLLPVKESEKIAEHILELGRNPSEIARMGEMSYRKCKSTFGLDVIVGQHFDLFESLVKKKSN